MKFLVLSEKEFMDTTVDKNAVAIRILDPKIAHSLEKKGFKAEIQMNFWDIEESFGSYHPISSVQVKQLLNFLIKYKDHNNFVFHCHAGQSRSVTIALFFAQNILRDDFLSNQIAARPDKSINMKIWDEMRTEFKKMGYKCI